MALSSSGARFAIASETVGQKMSDDVIVACVRSGTLYPFEYVIKLRNMLRRHLTVPYQMICLTDQPDRVADIGFVDVKEVGLVGWWCKFLIFEPAWRGRSQIIYFDLDTVVMGDVAQLASVPDEFAILESPVRVRGNYSYPCKYNSSVMVIGPGRCAHVWERFDKKRSQLMLKHDRYGDQAAIEEIYPDAAILNKLMPRGFFLNYRDLSGMPPKCAVINFGGSFKPHNCPIAWVQREWQ
jgi:hypothetical protein